MKVKFKECHSHPYLLVQLFFVSIIALFWHCFSMQYLTNLFFSHYGKIFKFCHHPTSGQDSRAWTSYNLPTQAAYLYIFCLNAIKMFNSSPTDKIVMYVFSKWLCPILFWKSSLEKEIILLFSKKSHYI
jgi:hypothetical protein